MPSAENHAAIYGNFLREMEASIANEEIAVALWHRVCQEIINDAATRSAFDFLRWPSLADFSVPEAWIAWQWYHALRESTDWDARWFPLTRESKVGNPIDYSHDFGTSPILVQHAYHLLKYEEATGKSFFDCDVIFEIGGGYGSFCRVLRNAGFTGLHIIYDLPQVSALQRLYLKLLGLKEVPPDKLYPSMSKEVRSSKTHGFSLISDAILDGIFASLAKSKIKVGFVATWSLSEMPMAIRDRLFPRFHQLCDRYLIAFQPAWDDMSNHDYFGAFPEARPDLNWRKEVVMQVPSFYLFA